MPGWMVETWLVPGAGWGGFPTPFQLGLETTGVVRSVSLGEGLRWHRWRPVATALCGPRSVGSWERRRGLCASWRGGRPWGLRVWFRAGGGQCLCRGHSGIEGGPGALGLALCPRRSVTPISRHTLASGGSWAADMGKPGSPGARTYAVPSAQSPRSRHLPPRAGPELPSLCPRMAWAELRRGAGGWT